MLLSVPLRFVRVVVPFVVAITVLAHGRIVHAGSVDTLIHQLENDSSDKVRLSAALNLTKLGDPKAILALAKALVNDSNRNVRGACAVGLGKLVTNKTPRAYRGLAISNLKRAASDDDSGFVKEQAKRALAELTGGHESGGGGGGGRSGSGAGGIYVNIGPMSSKTGSNDARLKALMHRTALSAFGRAAGSMMTSWPGGGVPSRAALARKQVAGFFIDGTLNKLDVRVHGSSAQVSCKISMLIASFPDKSMFGFLNGGASVQASSSPRDQAMASEDCVTAVVEDLIRKKIVPTIRSKVQ